MDSLYRPRYDAMLIFLFCPSVSGCIQVPRYLRLFVFVACVVFQMFNLPDQGFQRFSNQNNKKVLLTPTPKPILTPACEAEGELQQERLLNELCCRGQAQTTCYKQAEQQHKKHTSLWGPDEKIFKNNMLPSLCHVLFTVVFSPFERRSSIALINVLQSEQSK